MIGEAFKLLLKNSAIVFNPEHEARQYTIDVAAWISSNMSVA